MIEKFIFIFCYLLANTWSTRGHFITVIKNGNSYEYTLHNEPIEPPKAGYIASTDSLLQDFKAGKVQVQDLNNFNESFQTYFYFRQYEKLMFSLSQNIERMMVVLDPIALPDHHGDNMDFQNTKVNGFPHNNVETKYDTLNSEDQFKINLTAKSDLVVFTSEFRFHNSTYLLKYYLKECNFKAYLHGIRSNFNESPIRLSLEYLTDELQHTYNSSLENYVKVNEMVEKEFLNATITTYVPFIFGISVPVIRKRMAESELKYITPYLESMLSTLVKSAHQYIAAKGLNNFEVKPVYFKNAIDKTSKYNIQKCDGIKVEGILNYAKFQLTNSTVSTITSDFPVRTVLTDTILFTYPENGEKQAFVNFVVHRGEHKNSEKFNIKSIQLNGVCKEKYEMTGYEYTSSNDVEFLVSLELYNFDPKYELLVHRTADFIARSMNRNLFHKY